MSAQILELLLFAGVAFFLISKLLSVLGTTNEGDQRPAQGRSFFGEPGGMKDVTQAPEAIGVLQQQDLDDLIVTNNSTKIMQNLRVLSEKMPDFDLKRFVKGSKVAFEMILSSFESNDKAALDSLVDKRFLTSFDELGKRYGTFAKGVEAKVSDIYMLGHTAFVKVLFSGSNVTSKLSSLNEEWIFTKNISQSGPNWYLSNIEIA